jgi:hypothetical protein
MTHRQILTAAVFAGCAVSSAASALDIGDNTSVGGNVFLDVSHITNQVNGVDVNPTGTGFDIKRGYLIVDHKFNDVFSANLTTDLQFSSASTATVTTPTGTTTALTNQNTSGGVTEVMIKLLYLQAKFDDAFVLRAGSYESPWVQFVQQNYAYRFVEKTATDRLGFANTADWGVNASGAFGGKLVAYSVSVLDGGGYKNPTRTKDVDVEGRIGVTPVEWLTFGIGGYSGHLGQVTEANSGFASNTATRIDGLVNVRFQGLTVGGEYFQAKNYKTASASTGVLAGPGGVVVAATATGAVVNDTADGFSAWAAYAFTSQWAVFGRYDDVKPSKDHLSSLKDQFFDAGVDFKPYKGIDVALVYKNEKVTDGQIAISSADANSSYALGGTGAATVGAHQSGQFNEVGIYTAWKF